MVKAYVLSGEQVAKIVANYLRDQGVEIDTYNRGGHTIYPYVQVSPQPEPKKPSMICA